MNGYFTNLCNKSTPLDADKITTVEMLLEKDIFTDARDDILRIGPAPYTTSEQCEEVIRELFGCL